jgi:hypothetical protein
MTVDIAMLASIVGAAVTIASGIAFLTHPIRKIFNRLESDIHNIQGKIGDIERWTGAQQEDIDISLRERRVIFNAVRALNDWAIQSGGNGKCQEAKKQMDDFVHDFAHKGKSGITK